MNNELWLLPEGIAEILPPEAQRVEQLRRRLLDYFHSAGYLLTIPPLIEYLDALLTGVGRDLDVATFKLTDQISGRMLGVRGDMTPQVARIDAHHIKDDAINRLCYIGSILKTRPDGFGGSRSPIQLGAEIYGHAGTQTDLEIILLMLETLSLANVNPALTLDFGHVGIFQYIMRDYELPQELETTILKALAQKAPHELPTDLPAPLQLNLLTLMRLHGGIEVLDEAQQCLPDIPALRELTYLIQQVQQYYPNMTIHVDLAELRGYRYYTGVLFGAFVEGSGQAIALGGRYDDIGKAFGRSRPATGFSTDLRNLLSSATNTVHTHKAILAPALTEFNIALEQEIKRLRCAGEQVVRQLNQQQAWLECDRHLIYTDHCWQVVPI